MTSYPNFKQWLESRKDREVDDIIFEKESKPDYSFDQFIKKAEDLERQVDSDKDDAEEEEKELDKKSKEDPEDRKKKPEQDSEDQEKSPDSDETTDDESKNPKQNEKDDSKKKNKPKKQVWKQTQQVHTDLNPSSGEQEDSSQDSSSAES